MTTMATMTTTKLWNQPDVPHKDWTFTHMEDLKHLIGSCDFCGTALRYVHFLIHSEYPDEHAAGCCCAERLTRDPIGPKRREGRMKSKMAALDCWRYRRRRLSHNGNWYVRARGIHVITFQVYGVEVGERWAFRVDGLKSSDTWPTEHEAWIAAFDGWWNAVEQRTANAALLAELEAKLARLQAVPANDEIDTSIDWKKANATAMTIRTCMKTSVLADKNGLWPKQYTPAIS